jgi:hypothetical protein
MDARPEVSFRHTEKAEEPRVSMTAQIERLRKIPLALSKAYVRPAERRAGAKTGRSR